MDQINFGAGLGAQQKMRRKAIAHDGFPQLQQDAGYDLDDSQSRPSTTTTSDGRVISTTPGAGLKAKMDKVNEMGMREGPTVMKPKKIKRSLGDRQADVIYGKDKNKLKGIDWLKANRSASRGVGDEKYKQAREAVQSHKNLRQMQADISKDDTASADKRFEARGNSVLDNAGQRQAWVRGDDGHMKRIGSEGSNEGRQRRLDSGEPTIQGSTARRKITAGGPAQGALRGAMRRDSQYY